jgi:opacity protein-like surface antigen
MGLTYGAQLMYYLIPAFGLGIEFNAANYSEAEIRTQTLLQDNILKTSGQRYNVMLAGKINIMPSSKTRVYFPIGFGLTHYKGKFEGSGSFAGMTSTETSNGTAFYFGLGLEADLNDIFILGFETRYNGFFADKDKFNTDYLTDLSAMLKLGIKF